MTRFLAAMLAPVLLAACSQPAPTAKGASPSPSPSASGAASTAPAAAPGTAALGVLVNFPQGTGPANTGYDLALVNTSGKIAAHVHAAVRSFIHATGISAPAAFDLPEVSVSVSRVYYLDGDAQLRSLTADGTNAAVTRIAGTATAHAAFAVSPDDRRIAVSVLDYSRTPVSVRLYVEDLAGTNHVDLYASTTNHVWPVGWHNGHVVLGATRSAPFTQQGMAGNPYSAPSYHVADATNATRLATMGSGDLQNGCTPQGLLTPAGTACYTRTASAGTAGYFTVVGWDGHNVLPGNGRFSAAAGGWAAIGIDTQSLDLATCCDDSGNVAVRLPSGGLVRTSMKGQQADWVCWLDADHLLSGSVYLESFQPQVLTFDTDAVVPVSAKGFCAGVVPGVG
jgi:hypothetical protein